LLSLNRTGLYYQPVPPREQEVACKHRIDENYTTHPYYGYRRIAAQLHRDSQLINPKTMARYMQEMGLAAIYPGPNLSKRNHQAGIFPYLLANVKATTPNHIWGIDLTYIRLRGGWMYAGFDPGLVLTLCSELGTGSNDADRFRDRSGAVGTLASQATDLQ
jgi:putative transposase